MSNGPGKVQQAILRLLETADLDMGWTTAELCEEVYSLLPHQVRKSHRVSVLRALHGMTLPDPWTVKTFDSLGAGLYNACSLVGHRRVDPKYWPGRYEPHGCYFKEVEAARRARGMSVFPLYETGAVETSETLEDAVTRLTESVSAEANMRSGNTDKPVAAQSDSTARLNRLRALLGDGGAP